MKISGSTRLYGVIGYPIEHSLSPAIHNTAIEALNLDAVYVAFHVKPGRLREAVEGMKALGVKGFNVTTPFKNDVIKYIDEVDGEAGFVEAVNTVVESDGMFKGYTTDGVGAVEALRKILGSLEGLKFVVVGAGGAARALVYRLSSIPCRITILNRTVWKAKMIVEKLKPRSNAILEYSGLTGSEQSRTVPKADVVVNATPVGMTIPGSPVDLNLIHKGQLVFDMIYWPPETLLLREAKAKGAKTVNGLPMLVYQAAYSFKLWFKLFPPVETMLEVAERELRRRIRDER